MTIAGTALIASGENSIHLAYEIHGAENSQTLLLIQGLGMQLTDWPDRLVSELAAKYRVVVFDNRDAGLSSKVEVPADLEPFYAVQEMFEIPLNTEFIPCMTWRRMLCR